MGAQHLLRRAKGQEVEAACRRWLLKQHISLVASNFHSKYGEIDIIGQEESTLIFFEVRYRRENSYGSSAESVTYAKQQRIYKTALFFITQHPKFQHYNYRFDIIGATTYNGKIEFSWQKNAFQVRETWI